MVDDAVLAGDVRGVRRSRDGLAVANADAYEETLRAEGKIPAVVYGHGMDPLTVSVDRRELRQALSGAAGMNTILDLTIDGTVYPTLIKDIQRHPVKRNVQHIDFIQVNLNEEIVVSVPIHLEGEAKAVIAEGGLVDPSSVEVWAACAPDNTTSG